MAFRGETFAAMGSFCQPPPSSVLGIRKSKQYSSIPVTTQGMPGMIPQAGHCELPKGSMYPRMAFPVVRQCLASTTHHPTSACVLKPHWVENLPNQLTQELTMFPIPVCECS